MSRCGIPGGGEAHGKAEDIDRGIQLVAQQIA
jgi:hypothetical protein